MIRTSSNKLNLPKNITLKDDNGDLCTDKEIICSEFNEFFSSTPIINNNHTMNLDYTSFLNPSVSNSFFLNETNEYEVWDVVKKFKNSKSVGLDDISSFLLKQIIGNIITPLTHLINLSFRSGHFPDCFKISKLIPLFKSGCKNTISNYRPISLLSSISKILEKLVHNRLTSFLDKYNILTKYQYGFRPNSSTELAIFDLTHYISSNFESKLTTLGIFIDLRKAFDSLDHSILLAKLSNCGIRGVSLEWLCSYLTNRSHLVSIDDIKSNLLPMRSGVPQGSILGPLLFNIFLNDLVGSSSIAKFVLYADDTTILFHDSNINKLMQTANDEMNKIYNWLICNKLLLNFKKTNYIIFGPKISTNKFNTNLTIGNTNIDRVDCTKFLGIFLSSNLSWTEHINYLTTKISKNLGIINKLKQKYTFNIIKTLYYSLIYPYLTYCISIWGNGPKYLMHLCEKCQHSYLRILFKLKQSDHINSYFKLANILNIKQLYIFNNLKLFYKLFINNICHHINNIITSHTYVIHHSVRMKQIFRIPMVRTKLYLESTLISRMNLWNKLPDNNIKYMNFIHFKKIILHHILNNLLI